MKKKMTVVLFAALLFSAMVFGVVEKRVDINQGDYMIPGIFAMPDNASENAPAVLMIHGFASAKDEVGNFYKRLAAKLADLGYATLRFDFPGSGDHKAPFTATSPSAMVVDSKIAYEWLLNQEGIDKERTGVLGFSLGGEVGSVLAGSDSRVKALALWSTPASSFQSGLMDYRDQYYETAEKDGHVVIDLGWRTVDLSKEFFQSLFEIFPLHSIRNFTAPLLVIAGADDRYAPDAKELAFNAGSNDVVMRVLADADHIYHVLGDDQTLAETVIDLTANWFADKL